MPNERPRPGPRADTEETRRAILRAAQSLFMKLGYRAVTTRMVAEACGVKQPLLYYHFSDKQTLYLEVHREQAAASRTALERIAARQGESVPVRLSHVVRYLRQSYQQNMSLFFHELRYEIHPSVREAMRDLFHLSIIAPIMSIFEDGIRTGFLRASGEGGVPPRLAAYLLLSTLSNLSMSAEAEGELGHDGALLAEKEHDVAEFVVQSLIYGMVARPKDETQQLL
jgi:AcrR family transcriptional regulator